MATMNKDKKSRMALVRSKGSKHEVIKTEASERMYSVEI